MCAAHHCGRTTDCLSCSARDAGSCVWYGWCIWFVSLCVGSRAVECVPAVVAGARSAVGHVLVVE